MENWLGNAGKGGIFQSGVPNGLGRGEIRHLGWFYGLEMVRFAYLEFLVIADGPGKAGSQWHFFTLEGCGLPLVAVAGWGIAACVGPHSLTDRVLEGHMLSSLPLAARGLGVLHGLFYGWLSNYRPEMILYLACPI